MVSLFLLLGCYLSYIVDLFAALHELASASANITKARIIGARALKTLWRHLNRTSPSDHSYSCNLKRNIILITNEDTCSRL